MSINFMDERCLMLKLGYQGLRNGIFPMSLRYSDFITNTEFACAVSARLH